MADILLSDGVFKFVFLPENCSILIWISQESNQNLTIVGSDNGLAPNRCQAIIWTNDGPSYWGIYASLRLDELRVQLT